MLLKSFFWKNAFLGNLFIFVISFSLNLIFNDRPLINHDFTLYWYMTGCVFATTLSFIFWFILKILKK